MLDRRVGNQDGVGDRVHQQARIDELIWKQRAVGVGKFRLKFHRSGGRIDLVIHREQRAGGEFLLTFAIVSFDRQLSAGFELAKTGSRLPSGMVNRTVIGCN